MRGTFNKPPRARFDPNTHSTRPPCMGNIRSPRKDCQRSQSCHRHEQYVNLLDPSPHFLPSDSKKQHFSSCIRLYLDFIAHTSSFALVRSILPCRLIVSATSWVSRKLSGSCAPIRATRKVCPFRYHTWLDLTIILLTLAILLAYVLGILGFAYVLGPWTQTKGTLYWHNQPHKMGSY